MNPRSPVCRTCLGIISEGKAGYNIDEENGLIKNVRNIREMIMFCVPEMDVFISVNPSICETCLAILINVYNFKIRCMRVENAIRSYILANNIMEGSCVNLSNVVKQQILEVLKQKNWPPDVIREYIIKVDKCLKIPEKIPSDAFNALPVNFGSPCSTITGPVSKNLISPLQDAACTPFLASTTPILPNNQPENNQILNDLLNGSLTGTTTTLPSYEQAVKEIPPQTAPSGKKYLTVAKNLMPERREPFCAPKQLPGVNYHNPNTNSIAPSVSRFDSSAVESFQNTFLSTLNLISTSGGGREEAVLVRPQGSRRIASRFPLKHNVGPPNRCPASPTEKIWSRKELLSQEKAKKPSGLRAIRKFLGAKDKRKEQDIIILDDDDSEPVRAADDGTFVMNFDDSENVVVDETITRNSAEPDKEISKRKLSPEDVIEEILSNRKRLRVNLNPSLPYLHKNKKLVVKVRKDTFLKCALCPFAAFEEKDLINHSTVSHRICKLCNQQFDRKMSLDQHIGDNHSAELKDLLKLCEGEKTTYDCHLCNFIGLCTLDLRDHRIRIHIKCDESGMYTCPFTPCDVKDAMAYNVAKHAEWRHDSPRRRECQLCNYIARSVAALKVHVHSHSLTKISCPLCGTNCKTSSSLEKHMEKRHAEASNQGLVYTSRSDHLGTLTTDTDGRITLNLPGLSTRESIPAVTQNIDAPSIFDGPSLSELLCAETFNPIPDQEDDCTIIDEVAQKQKDCSVVRRKSVILNKRNRKSTNKTVLEDSEDCVIISENVPSIDLSLEETHAENSTQSQGYGDVIEIIDDECEALTGDPSKDVSIENINSRPDDSETDTCSEVSTVHKHNEMLDKQKEIVLGTQKAAINNSEKELHDKTSDNVVQHNGNLNTPIPCTEPIDSEKGNELDQNMEKHTSEALVETTDAVSQYNPNTESCSATLDGTDSNQDSVSDDRNKVLKSGADCNEIVINDSISNAENEANDKLGQAQKDPSVSDHQIIETETENNNSNVHDKILNTPASNSSGTRILSEPELAQSDLDEVVDHCNVKEPEGELQRPSSDNKRSESETIEENLEEAVINKPKENVKTVDTDVKIPEDNLCLDVTDNAIWLDSEHCPEISQNKVIDSSTMECDSIGNSGEENQSGVADAKKLDEIVYNVNELMQQQTDDPNVIMNTKNSDSKTVDSDIEIIKDKICHDVSNIDNEISSNSQFDQSEDKVSDASNIESFLTPECIASAQEGSASGETGVEEAKHEQIVCNAKEPIANPDTHDQRSRGSENSILKETIGKAAINEPKEDIVMMSQKELRDDTAESTL